MPIRRHVFTRRELTALDKFEQGATIKSIAGELNANTESVADWLRALGTYRRKHKPHSDARQMTIREPKCARCEVLLKYTEGNHDGICGLCHEDLARLSVLEQRRVKLDYATVMVEDMARV